MLKYLFLHMHKTGGTSVVENFWKPSIPLDERYLEEDHLPGGPREQEAYLYNYMYCTARDFRLNYRDVFTAFWNTHLPRDRRLYLGHFGYGIHDVIGGPCRYATVVRDPIARTISHFHVVKSLKAFDGDFGDYIQSGGIETSNYQTMLLTRDGFSRRHCLTVADLDEALHNLTTEFDFCVTEDIDDFVDELIVKYRRPIVNARIWANRTDDSITVKGSPLFVHERFPVDESAMGLLIEKNQLDLVLYQSARDESRRRRRKTNQGGNE